MKTKSKHLPMLLAGALLMALLIACGATTGDEEAAAENVAETPASALEPVEEETTVDQNDESNVDQNSGAETLESGTPVEVDLSEITPEAPDEDAEPREMPEPGRPGPNRALMDAIMADLAERRGVSLDDLSVDVENVEAQEWRDSSMGCPAEGMMYMQVITPGYLVELSSGGEQYEYHTDQNENFVLCVDGQPAE